jgi:hypothetical protein
MMFRVLALVVGVLLSTPASSQTPDPLANPRVRVAADASRLRYYMSASVEAGLSLLDAQEQRVLTSALRENGDASTDAYWPLALGASVQMNDIRVDQALIGWWNPVTDAGLATRWRLRDGDWRLEAAAAFLGEDVRGRRNASAWAGPAWALASETDMGGALQTLAFDTRAAVRNGALARAFTGATERRAVLSRAYGAYASVPREDDADSASSLVGMGEKILVRQARGGEENRAAFDAALRAIPTEARLMFAPQAAVRRGVSTTMLWATAGAPDRVFLLTFDAQAGAQAALTHIAAIDLAGASAQGNTP